MRVHRALITGCVTMIYHVELTAYATSAGRPPNEDEEHWSNVIIALRPLPVRVQLRDPWSHSSRWPIS